MPTLDQPRLLSHQTEQPKGDRYDRLAEATKALANDKNLIAADTPYNAQGLKAFSAGIAEKRLLDGLSEGDADTVMLFSLLDYTQGVQRMAWRISDICKPEPQIGWDYHDDLAVARSLARILYLFLGAMAFAFDDSETPSIDDSEVL